MTSASTPLEDLHATFRELLLNEPKPESDLALFWHEVAPTSPVNGGLGVITRGLNALTFHQGCRELDPIPSQFKLPKEDWPERVCRRVFTEGSSGPDGIHRVTYRYERGADGVWSGGFAVETNRQVEALQTDRAALDARLLDWMTAQWTSETVSMGFQYGFPNWDTPGPRYRIQDEKKNVFLDPPPALQEIFADLVRLVHAHGHAHLYTFGYYAEAEGGRVSFPQVDFLYGV